MRLWTRFNGKDPRNCLCCAFWDGSVYTINSQGKRVRIHKGTGCVFGCENCPFVNDQEPPPPPEPKHKCCKGCPYGAHQPCIGWCTRKVLGEIDVVE